MIPHLVPEIEGGYPERDGEEEEEGGEGLVLENSRSWMSIMMMTRRYVVVDQASLVVSCLSTLGARTNSHIGLSLNRVVVQSKSVFTLFFKFLNF